MAKPARRPLSPVELTAELYRGALGREPDEGGLLHYSSQLAEGGTLATLLRSLIDSDEFQARFKPSETYLRVDLDDALPIELDLSAAALARLWSHIGAVWNGLGDTDPYWSVISHPRFRLELMDDAATLNRFYQSGHGELDRLTAWLARNRLALRPDMVCAEYGCGVGRLTGWLAEACRRLHAFDISPTHLGKARAWTASLGRRNVSFHLVRRPADLRRMRGCDLFFSVMVLQHNPPPIIRLILGEAFRQLNPGGIAFFQLPTHRRDYRFDLAEYLGHIEGAGTIEMHCLPQQDVFAVAARHGLVPLEVQQDGLINEWGTSHSFLFHKPAIGQSDRSG